VKEEQAKIVKKTYEGDNSSCVLPNCFLTKGKSSNISFILCCFSFFPITSPLAPFCFENQHHGNSFSDVGTRNKIGVGEMKKLKVCIKKGG